MSYFIVGDYPVDITYCEPIDLDNLYLAVSFTHVIGCKANLFKT